MAEVCDKCESTDRRYINKIYLDLPDPGVASDEDDAEEDSGGIVDHVNRSLLRANAEVHLAGGDMIGTLVIDDEDDDEDEEEDQSLVTDNFLRELKSRIYTDWRKSDPARPATEVVFPNEDHQLLFDELGQMTPVHTFELFFDNDIFQLLQFEMTRYAIRSGRSIPEFTVEEIKKCFGVLILSGYVPVPDRGDMWSNDNDLRNQLVAESIRRDRFDQFMANCHWADNNDVSTRDKLWKIRPLIDRVQTNFRKFYFPTCTGLNFDEAMIKYFGRHGCKQFIPVKPIRFGFKVWCLNAPNGYLLDFNIYQGNDPFVSSAYQLAFGKCAAPLIMMFDNLKYKNIPYDIFQDNLFTSQALLEYCRHLGYTSTGTVRKDRGPKGANFTKRLAKRGDFQYYYSAASKIVVIQWYDNKIVTVASNGFGVNPTLTVKRWSKTSNKIIQIQQPNAIAQYNKSMGGTDRMNQNINNYRIAIRSKKWYWCIFSWTIDAALQNSWLLYRQFSDERSITFYQFKRRIARFYLESYSLPPSGPGRYRTYVDGDLHMRTPPEIRYDGKDHLIDEIPIEQFANSGSKDLRKRCAMHCRSRSSKFWCIKCKVPLCPSGCFRNYHTKSNNL